MNQHLAAVFSVIFMILCIYLLYKRQYLSAGYLTFAYIAVWLIVDTIQRSKG